MTHKFKNKFHIRLKTTIYVSRAVPLGWYKVGYSTKHTKGQGSCPSWDCKYLQK